MSLLYITPTSNLGHSQLHRIFAENFVCQYLWMCSIYQRILIVKNHEE